MNPRISLNPQLHALSPDAKPTPMGRPWDHHILNATCRCVEIGTQRVDGSIRHWCAEPGCRRRNGRLQVSPRANGLTLLAGPSAQPALPGPRSEVLVAV